MIKPFKTREEASLHAMALISKALRDAGLTPSEYSSIAPGCKNIRMFATVTKTDGKKEQIEVTIK